MSRLTADERRRANELRRIGAKMSVPRAITIEHLEAREAGEAAWGRGARVTTLVTVALGAALALVQLAQQLAVYGAASWLDWLLPRL